MHHRVVVPLAASLALSIAACGGKAVPPPVAVPAPTPAPVVVPPSTAAAVASSPVPPDAAATFLATCLIPVTQAKTELAKLVGASGQRTIDNTLEPYNEISRLVENAAQQAGLFHEVHPDPKVREAARTCEREVMQFNSELLLDRRVFDAIKAVDVAKADPDTRRFAMLSLRDYRRAGVDLDDAQRARIKVIDDEMTQLGQQFEKGVADDTRSIEVADVGRLAGLPPDWIAAHKPDATGAIKISTDYPDYYPAMTHADDDALRKQLYIAFHSRGAQHNEEHLGKLLVLRAEKAKLLGFKDWADYQSDDKMLKGGKPAADFVERIAKLARARAQRDYNELLAQLKKHDAKAKAVGDWQRMWLEDQIEKEQYAVDSNEVRQYFAFEPTLAGLLEITSKMYDIQYVAVTDAHPWHPDVHVFDVMRGADKLGRIFLDMHPRDGKYKHAAQFPILNGVIGKQLPEGALVCNLPDPKSSGGPALMDHGDVVVMFHEFGHLMHHVLGGHQRWVSQSGVATEQDFVEAPSQMFEEWSWSYETLSRFAKHHQTGEVISKQLVAKMNKARKFGLGTGTLQQMFYAAVALEFHQADPAKLDQLATVKKLQARFTPFAYVDGTKFHASFEHLVGYSSMYYTYMWSLVIARDLLTAFDPRGLMDLDTAHRYRDKILAAGGTKEAADLVKDFLGRPYSFQAFERYLAD